MTESEYYYNKCSQETLFAERVYEMQIANLNIEYEYKLFSILKPSVSKDGNQWCVLYGQNLQEGISGFGDTLYLAILDFNKKFNQ